MNEPSSPKPLDTLLPQGESYKTEIYFEDPSKMQGSFIYEVEKSKISNVNRGFAILFIVGYFFCIFLAINYSLQIYNLSLSLNDILEGLSFDTEALENLQQKGRGLVALVALFIIIAIILIIIILALSVSKTNNYMMGVSIMIVILMIIWAVSFLGVGGSSYADLFKIRESLGDEYKDEVEESIVNIQVNINNLMITSTLATVSALIVAIITGVSYNKK